jgi:hypothetical protein
MDTIHLPGGESTEPDANIGNVTRMKLEVLARRATAPWAVAARWGERWWGEE